MNLHVTLPHSGRVTLALAAAALKESGDPIHPSNLSRYLDRFPEIPQEKRGKYRLVDLPHLRAHRRANFLVAEKRSIRPEAWDADEAPLLQVRNPAPRLADAEDDAADAQERPGNALTDANLRIKQLTIRERELDLAEREGSLVPAGEVQALLTSVTQALISELERQEQQLALRHGREVAADVRRARKAAQQAASDRLVEMAQKLLPPGANPVRMDAAAA